MKQKKFSLKSRLQSFQYAFNGFKTLFSEEHNSRIHLFITVIVVLLGFYFQLSNPEWIFITICIAFVFFAELLNSSIENIADFISPEKHPTIKKVKDLAAAAVLVSAISSVIIGLIIFLPKIFG
jgi:undecaprenol kinase/diacylglycerol kinase (ATP)